MAEDSSEIETGNDFTKYKVVDLKRMLKTKGLSTTGNKQELVERLQNSDAAMEELLEASHPGEEAFDEELEELDETALMADEKDLPVGTKEKLEDDDVKLEEGGEEPPNKKKKVSINRASPSLISQEEVGVVIEKDAGKEEEKRVEEGGDVSTTTEGKEDGAKDQVGAEDKKIIKLKEMSTLEKLSLRAQKFGLSESAKKEMRAARFGIPTQLTVQETLQKRAQRFSAAQTDSGIKIPATTDAKLLKKRAERFGIKMSTQEKVENDKKLEMRKERFQSLPGEEKKPLRTQRLKLVT